MTSEPTPLPAHLCSSYVFAAFSYQLKSVGSYLLFLLVCCVRVFQPGGSMIPAELSKEALEETAFMRQDRE